MEDVIIIILFIIMLLVVKFNQEPPMLSNLKDKYWRLLDILRKSGDPMWIPVCKPAIITGLLDWDKSKGPIGSNVNKGYEIYICLDGDDANSAFYVLIHELAHMAVPEYDHTHNFWGEFNKLKKIAIDNGLYVETSTHQYCGDTILKN